MKIIRVDQAARQDISPVTRDGLSWRAALTDLQGALDSAGPGDEVWVADRGWYMATRMPPPSQPRGAMGWAPHRPMFVVRPGISVIGGFSGHEMAITERVPDRRTAIRGGGIFIVDEAVGRDVQQTISNFLVDGRSWRIRVVQSICDTALVILGRDLPPLCF